MTKTAVQAAQQYRAAGLSIIPFQAGTKFPDLEALRSSGNINFQGRASWQVFYRRLATDAEFDAWFASGDRNVGILTGFRHLLALDFDDAESYAAWSAAYGDVARGTSTQRTPRGFHVLFRWPSVWTTRWLTSIGFRLVRPGGLRAGEIKGSYDFIAAWPSIAEGRGHYAWLAGQAPWETEILMIERLAEIGIQPVSKIPQAYFAFLRKLVTDPGRRFPQLLTWVKYRYDKYRGAGARYY
jgi:hypothetical protein